MAYLTCPWCLTPQMVGEDSDYYQCFTCYGEIQFFVCPDCGFIQTVNKKWARFICSNCDSVVELPRRWGYAPGAQAYRVQGAGLSWPKL